MSQPKIRINYKSEQTETSKKLTFTSHSRAEARKQLSHTSQDNKQLSQQKRLPSFQTSTIYKELFENSSHDRDIRKEERLGEHSTFQDYAKMDESTEQEINRINAQSYEQSLDQEKIEDEPSEQEPFSYFPNIYGHPHWSSDLEWNQEGQGQHVDEIDQQIDEDRAVERDRYWSQDRDLDQGQDRGVGLGLYSAQSLEKIQDESIKKGTFDSIFNVIASVFLAIILGAVFGFLLYNMIISGYKSSPQGEPTQVNQTTNPVSGLGDQSPSAELIPYPLVDFDLSLGNKTDVQMGSLTVSDRTFYGVQGGAFTEAVSAQLALEENRKNYFPSILFKDDVYRLFLGIAYKRNDALDLAGYFQNRGIETYLKEYTIQGGNISIPSAKKEEMEVLNNFFIHGTFLLDKTSAWSGDGVAREVNITEEEWQNFRNTHQRFLEESKQVLNFLPENKHQYIDQMSTNMNVAVTGMVEYFKQPEINYLFESQQALLNYFNGYRDLLQSFGININVS